MASGRSSTDLFAENNGKTNKLFARGEFVQEARLNRRWEPARSYNKQMHLLKLVELVSRVRAITKKTEKAALLAEFLRQTHGRETELAGLYLCGALAQGK